MNKYKIHKYLFKISQNGGSNHIYRRKLNYYSQNGGSLIDSLENAISIGLEFCESPPPPDEIDHNVKNENINTAENVLYIINKQMFNIGYVIKINRPYNTFFTNDPQRGLPQRVSIEASDGLKKYVNAPATNGNILIHTAAKMLNKLMFGLLVNYAGADIRAKDINGNNAFHYAYAYNKEEEADEFITFVLINFGVDKLTPLLIERNNLNQRYTEGFSDGKVQSAVSAPASVAQPPKKFVVGEIISEEVYVKLYNHVVKNGNGIINNYNNEEYVIYKNARNGISIQLLAVYNKCLAEPKMSMGFNENKIMIWHNNNPAPTEKIPVGCEDFCNVLDNINI